MDEQIFSYNEYLKWINRDNFNKNIKKYALLLIQHKYGL